jgi:hypothetical protein
VIVGEVLTGAREAYARQAWASARAGFAQAAVEVPLTIDDIERWAVAAHLTGNEAESRDVLARGHREALQRKDVTRAVRFAFLIGHGMMFTGEWAQAKGWLARARNLLTERGADCVAVARSSSSGASRRA